MSKKCAEVFSVLLVSGSNPYDVTFQSQRYHAIAQQISNANIMLFWAPDVTSIGSLKSDTNVEYCFFFLARARCPLLDMVFYNKMLPRLYRKCSTGCQNRY